MLQVELKKILFHHKGLLLLLIALAAYAVFCVGSGYDSSYVIDRNEDTYLTYMERWQGEITEEKAQEMEALIAAVKGRGDTIGGVITCVVRGCPVGLGQPAFGKLHAALGAAMLSINAAKGFEYGEGFGSMHLTGSQQNDLFYDHDGRIDTRTNHSGGIQGGISNGQDIYFRVAFKPVATVLMEQATVDTAGHDTHVTARGRHDPCVLPRAVPIVEAMTAMTLLDYYLLNKTTHL